MSLPAPELDTRKFQQIVDDVKSQIGLRCPEWTDHNVSDPGVTLIELFAYVAEMLLFQMNRVPERNYVKFLELLGIELGLRAPATTDLRYTLVRPLEDGGDDLKVTIPLHSTVATRRTDTEDALEFSTDIPLMLEAPRLTHVLTLPGDVLPEREAAADVPARIFDLLGQEKYSAVRAFPVYGDTPRQNDRLYFGFARDVSGHLLEVDFRSLTSIATGRNVDYPPQIWERYDPFEEDWTPIVVVRDGTHGFSAARPRQGVLEGEDEREEALEVPGTIQLEMPAEMKATTIAGRSAYWIRCRYTVRKEDVPPRGPRLEGPSAYHASPKITRVFARTVGGVVQATHCTRYDQVVLGESDGTPGQRFRLPDAPVFPFSPAETVVVGKRGSTPTEILDGEEWLRVPDFTATGPEDRHFVLDAREGTIHFGPAFVQPNNGRPERYGRIPEKGMLVAVTGYRTGGGLQGNVREHKVVIDKGNQPEIADVTNPRPAQNGAEPESLDRAKMRAAQILKVRNRAVTREDYVMLAEEATTGVGKAFCLQPSTSVAPSTPSTPKEVKESRTARGGEPYVPIKPGEVRVLVIPRFQIDAPRPRDLELPERTRNRVRKHLDERRLLTVQLDVRRPRYVFVSTAIRVVVDPKLDAERVAVRIQERLLEYIHPLTGGPEGTGWPFGRALTMSDLYAQIGSVNGVAFLLGARIYESVVTNWDLGLLSNPQRVEGPEGVRLDADETLCSRNHTVHLVPMSASGQEWDDSVGINLETKR